MEAPAPRGGRGLAIGDLTEEDQVLGRGARIGRAGGQRGAGPLQHPGAERVEAGKAREVDDERATGRQVGMKPAGGIRTAKEAIGYLVVLYETLGPAWMTPERFRFGASSLLNDCLMQLRKERTGSYQGPDYFTID